MGPIDLPPGLLEFQLTLRPPAGMSAVEVLKDADAYSNQDPPATLSPEVRCAHFPPTLLLVGGRDPRLPESVAMAKRLSEHGVAHELAVVPGAPHGFCSCRPIRRTPRSSRRSTTSCTSAA
jgi:acetyl esterase/lipase